MKELSVTLEKNRKKEDPLVKKYFAINRKSDFISSITLSICSSIMAVYFLKPHFRKEHKGKMPPITLWG